MNDTDTKKLHTAIQMITSLEGHLTNLAKRGPNAAKAWATTANFAAGDVQKKLKTVIIPSTVKMVKDTKTVLADLKSLWKAGSDAKKVATYPSGKEFREKVAAKLLNSCKAFDENTARLRLAVVTALPDGSETFYPACSEIDVQAVMVYIKNFSSEYNSLRIAFAKL